MLESRLLFPIRGSVSFEIIVALGSSRFRLFLVVATRGAPGLVMIAEHCIIASIAILKSNQFVHTGLDAT